MIFQIFLQLVLQDRVAEPGCLITDPYRCQLSTDFSISIQLVHLLIDKAMK